MIKRWHTCNLKNVHPALELHLPIEGGAESIDSLFGRGSGVAREVSVSVRCCKTGASKEKEAKRTAADS